MVTWEKNKHEVNINFLDHFNLVLKCLLLQICIFFILEEDIILINLSP